MKAFWLVLTLMFASVCSLSQSDSKQKSAIAVYDDGDAYQVYMAILPVTREMKHQGLGQLLIQQETQPLVDMTDCERPKGRFANLASAFDSYRAANKGSWQLVPKFDRMGPYRLESEVTLRNAPKTPPPVQWITLSAVGFNESRTLAIVYVQLSCSLMLCESGSLYAAQKKNGKWEPIDWLNECGWIS